MDSLDGRRVLKRFVPLALAVGAGAVICVDGDRNIIDIHRDRALEDTAAAVNAILAENDLWLCERTGGPGTVEVACGANRIKLRVVPDGAQVDFIGKVAGKQSAVRMAVNAAAGTMRIEKPGNLACDAKPDAKAGDKNTVVCSAVDDNEVFKSDVSRSYLQEVVDAVKKAFDELCAKTAKK